MKDHLITTIYDDNNYLGWPTIARHPKTGRLFVAFSGGRQGHVCPCGKAMLITSDDQGETWSQAKTLADCPIDDRDAGVCITPAGTVIVNWFTSIAYSVSDWARKAFPEQAASVTDEMKKKELGCWSLRSEDNGETFSSERIPTIANSPHGPCVLSDGRLFFIGKLIDSPEERVKTERKGAPFSSRFGCSVSDDDGRTWQLLTDKLPVAEGEVATAYHEYHAVQCDSGRIVAQIRNHSQGDAFGTSQMESTDGGLTWTTPHHVCMGFPSHLLKLRDGRLLMSYSYRFDPFGNFARMSEDEGETWSPPFVFGPARKVDMGYPSSAELDDGTLLSVWYENVQGSNPARAVLRMARWSW